MTFHWHSFKKITRIEKRITFIHCPKLKYIIIAIFYFAIVKSRLTKSILLL